MDEQKDRFNQAMNNLVSLKMRLTLLKPLVELKQRVKPDEDNSEGDLLRLVLGDLDEILSLLGIDLDENDACVVDEDGNTMTPREIIRDMEDEIKQRENISNGLDELLEGTGIQTIDEWGKA